MSLDTTEPLTGRAGVEAEYGYTPLPDRERDDDASNETYSSDFEGLRDAAADVAERRAELSLMLRPELLSMSKMASASRSGTPYFCAAAMTFCCSGDCGALSKAPSFICMRRDG
jgi:hypothetical protein